MQTLSETRSGLLDRNAPGVDASAYLRLLEPWVRGAERELHTPPGYPEFLVYGSGFNSWGVQTHQKAFTAYAVLAIDPDLDSTRTGLSREILLDRALRMLRFNLESHHAGGFTCLDGSAWGHTWISALGTERMMHAVDLLMEHLDDRDLALLRQVMISESDWLVDGYCRGPGQIPGVVQAGLVKNNDPESNIWNGVFLHRTAMMFPDAPRATEYREQGTRFLLNGISIEKDAADDTLYDGRPLSEWHVGANFFPSYALNHHAYLNVGYMVITLSQLAIGHFSWKSRGLEAPKALYLHAYELWKTVKRMIFPDGRLCRIGGDTRVRYCYCQDYAIPTWLFMLDHFGETDCLAFEEAWMKTVTHEISTGDGETFLGTRLASMADVSPTYYTRLESDRAAAFSMALAWRRRYDDFQSVEPAPDQAPAYGGWHDDYHGATLHHSKRRIASFTWRAAEPPQGLCVPTDRSDLAEWRWNLTGRILGTGARNLTQCQTFHAENFEGGFVNAGVGLLNSGQQLAEGEADRAIARQHILFAALPDDATVICLQYASSINRSFVRSIKGLFYQIPNDLFNHGRRTYHTETGAQSLPGPAEEADCVNLDSRWINVDDAVGIHLLGEAPGSLHMNRESGRQVALRDKPFAVPSLYVDEICAPCSNKTRSFDPDAPILDLAFAVQVGVTGEETRSTAANSPGIHFQGNGFRAAMADGVDGKTYLAVHNLLATRQDVTLAIPVGRAGKALRNLVTHARISPTKNTWTVTLAAHQGALFVLE